MRNKNTAIGIFFPMGILGDVLLLMLRKPGNCVEVNLACCGRYGGSLLVSDYRKISGPHAGRYLLYGHRLWHKSGSRLALQAFSDFLMELQERHSSLHLVYIASLIHTQVGLLHNNIHSVTRREGSVICGKLRRSQRLEKSIFLSFFLLIE